MMKMAFLFGLLSVMLVGCPTRIPPSTGLTTNVVDDAGPSEAGTDDAKSDDSDGAYVDNCALACVNLRKPAVRCPAGFSVDGGEDCARACRHARDSRLMPLDILCAMKARTLQEAHGCKGWGC